MALIFDFETTGLLEPSADKEKQPSIIEVFCLKVDDETLEEVDFFHSLVNPKKNITPKITEITGIMQKDLTDKPAFTRIYPLLCEFFLGERRLIAHNLTFDRDILYFELARIGKERAFPWPYDQICTVEQTMMIKGHRLKLMDLYQHLFDEKFEDAHRAESDVRALHRIYKHLVESGEL